jgi:hypothetical protein
MTTALEGGEWSAARRGRNLPPGKTRYQLYRSLGGPTPVWTGGENLAPTGIRSPDRPPRSQSLYRLSYPAHSLAYSNYRRAQHSLQICRSVVLAVQFSCRQTYVLQIITHKNLYLHVRLRSHYIAVEVIKTYVE